MENSFTNDNAKSSLAIDRKQSCVNEDYFRYKLS